jgi:GNAT superfamily N-acetyltransferase
MVGEEKCVACGDGTLGIVQRAAGGDVSSACGDAPDPRELTTLRQRVEELTAQCGDMANRLLEMSANQIEEDVALGDAERERDAAQTAARQAEEAVKKMKPLVIQLRELLGGILSLKIPDDANDTTRALVLAGVNAQVRFCDRIAADIQMLSSLPASPAAMEAKPLCVCGHRKIEHSEDTNRCLAIKHSQRCECERFTPAPPVAPKDTFAPKSSDAPGASEVEYPPVVPTAASEIATGLCGCGHPIVDHYGPTHDGGCTYGGCACYGCKPNKAPPVAPSAPPAASDALKKMEARKDAAYRERNQVVAGLAMLAVRLGYKAGTAKTAIEGWSEDWHGCVYIELPTGQVSWHFHDSQASFFDFLPPYEGKWDGHDTEEKYGRLAAMQADLVAPPAASGDAERRDREWTQASPTEPGIYWYWDGETTMEPLPVFVGGPPPCFVRGGQLGRNSPALCSEFDGWWMRLPIVHMPSVDALSAKNIPAAQEQPVAQLVEEDYELRVLAARVPANDIYAERLVLLAMPGRTDECPRVRGTLTVPVDADITDGEIDYLFVVPEFRHKGIGRRLWNAAEKVLGRTLNHAPITDDGEAFAESMQSPQAASPEAPVVADADREEKAIDAIIASAFLDDSVPQTFEEMQKCADGLSPEDKAALAAMPPWAPPASAPKGEQTTVRWTISTNEETFWGEFSSREEAVAELTGNYGSGGWVGEIQDIEPGDYASGHADRVIEEISMRLSEDVGEAGEKYPDYNKEDEKALDSKLAAVISEWMVGRIGCSRVINVERVDAPVPVAASEATPETPSAQLPAEDSPPKGETGEQEPKLNPCIRCDSAASLGVEHNGHFSVTCEHDCEKSPEFKEKVAAVEAWNAANPLPWYLEKKRPASDGEQGEQKGGA